MILLRCNKRAKTIYYLKGRRINGEHSKAKFDKVFHRYHREGKSPLLDRFLPVTLSSH